MHSARQRLVLGTWLEDRLTVWGMLLAGAKCVAVSAQDPYRVGPPLGAVPSTGTTAEEAAWLVDLVGMLKSQDNSYFYKKQSTALTCKAAPVVVKHRGGQVQSTVICLLVANNPASLKAMALAKQFMITEQHTMLVLHLVQNSAEQRIARTTWLSAFEVRLVSGHQLARRPVGPGINSWGWGVLTLSVTAAPFM